MPNPMSLGITAKLYVNAGTYGTPIWTECDLVSDLMSTQKWNEGDSSVRGGRVQTAEPTNLLMEVTGKIRKKLSDGAFAILRTAFLAGTIVDIMILDGPIDTNTSEGVRWEGIVFNMSEDQGLQAVIFKEFSMKPSAQTDNKPKSVVISSGSPVYSEFGS